MKIYQNLLTPNCKKNQDITFEYSTWKKNAESQERRNFESVRALLVIFTRVTTLQSCYNFAGVLHENAIVSANQCVIFSCALLIPLNAAAFISFFVIRSLKFCTIKTHQRSLEMKIYRTASKSVIKTNAVQKVFFCLKIDLKYMNTVIDQRGKECWEVREQRTQNIRAK